MLMRTLAVVTVGVALAGCAPAEPTYRDCADSRAHGAAPLHAGDRGYSRQLDRDGDGTACETGIHPTE